MEGKEKKLTAIRAVLSSSHRPLEVNTGKTQGNSANPPNPLKGEITAGKGKRLRDLILPQIQREVVSASRHREHSRETVKLANGWCHVGFPKQLVYRVEDLVSLWRALMTQHFRENTPPLPFPWFLRPKILDWLRADGHAICEKVVVYSVTMWEPLQTEFDIEAEHPTMNVIWGFRRIFYKRMRQSGDDRKWGAHWNAEEATAETDSRFVVS